MRIEKIAAEAPAPYGRHDADALDDLVVYVDRVLVKQHAAIGTTQLIRLLVSQPSDTEMKNLVAWLRLARSLNKLEGYFTQGKPTHGTFGKPRILWLLTPDARNDIETYRSSL